MDLTGITNVNEYYTNHYLAAVFEENAGKTIAAWRSDAKETQEIRAPWSYLKENARQFYTVHDRYLRSKFNMQTLISIQAMADAYMFSLGYPKAKPETIELPEGGQVPVYLELCRSNGAPHVWVLLAASEDTDEAILDKHCFDAQTVVDEGVSAVYKDQLVAMHNEELATKILFSLEEPPRFLLFIGMNQIALIDRNKWNEKRYLQFELEEIFSRHVDTTLEAMAVLLHKDSLCPVDGKILLDELDEDSQRHAAGVSEDLKYALRESIELLGNEVLYDMEHRQERNLQEQPVDAGKLTLECLRYMYRMLFVLFIESRKDLGYAPINEQVYMSGYSLESLRDIADHIREEAESVGEGYYLHETLAKLYELIYDGYPKTEEELQTYGSAKSLNNLFVIAPLKAHIFDPEYTKMITKAKIRNSVMLRIVELMSLTRATGKKKGRGRISYANLGINQMGAVYEALLSYRGFIAEHDLYEVKRAGDKFSELDVGYFVPESELEQYTEEERVRYDDNDIEKKGKLCMYPKGTFIYRLAGREREKSASYYTPEVLTKCLVKYALNELLQGKSADEILHLTICEPAMGSAAFLNEAINQVAEAYLDRKQKETGNLIEASKRVQELQKVKMFIADRNVYGIDLNPVAVELAEVSLWLNTIYSGGFVPWFGTQLVNGNSLIGARRQCYRVSALQTKSKGLRWYENVPERVPLDSDKKRMPKTQIYHFLLGDTGMCNYTDKVIKKLESENIKLMKDWNKNFTVPYSDDDVVTLLRLSGVVDQLWQKQIQLRKEVESKTQDNLSVYGYEDDIADSCTTIREKDKIFSELYKSEHMRNADAYARLKFAMDYWCALWFWPIDKAEMLPTRSEFLFDMSLILEGTTDQVQAAEFVKKGQQSLFPNAAEKMVLEFRANITDSSVVDIAQLCKIDRLECARRIAVQNHFMHWELEFADLFAERGGFDLIIGNPPWIKLEWDEQSVLSDKEPLMAIKFLTIGQKTQKRAKILQVDESRNAYLQEYTNRVSSMTFMGAKSCYPDLNGQQPDLFKAFLPQAWRAANEYGIIAFIHPEGVYDDPKGGKLRHKIYGHIKKHYQFQNELMLFSGVAHQKRFSLNIYSNVMTDTFESISDLFDPKTIDMCYENNIKGIECGIKDINGNWNISGSLERVLHIGKNELKLFARVFDNNDNWKQARMPMIHTRTMLNVLSLFAGIVDRIDLSPPNACGTKLWDESNDQKNNYIARNVHFPETKEDVIYSGPHIGVANPLFKTSRRICIQKSDYDVIDLTNISTHYLPRGNYAPKANSNTYYKRIPETTWGNLYIDNYRVVSREMANRPGERTLISAIYPPRLAHICTQYGICFKNINDVPLIAGCFASIPYDFYIKSTGKAHINGDTISSMPYLGNKIESRAILVRTMLLNCLTIFYSDLWRLVWSESFCEDNWAKNDKRLNRNTFLRLKPEWNFGYPLKFDFERREALIELDVLVAMGLGMTLNQLVDIYRIQFPVLQSYEADTWYDVNGRIVFTINRSLTGVGVDRATWENTVRHLAPGEIYRRTYTDDTMPGEAVERTIDYVAPFDCCDREKDYEMAWKFFDGKYGGDK